MKDGDEVHSYADNERNPVDSRSLSLSFDSDAFDEVLFTWRQA